MAEKRELPSLYVGETSRSVGERAAEHWADKEKGEEECHMIEHFKMVHRAGAVPEFNFKVVKGCKSAMERQVREAVRIQLRGTVLNKKGGFNRSKLTRMAIDEEWDKKTWEEAWVQEPNQEDDPEAEVLIGSKKSMREEGRNTRSKRRKVEDVEGQVWGEQMPEEERERQEFLQSKEESKGGGTVQTKLRLQVMTGKEWFCLEVVKGVVGMAMAQISQMEGVGEWEEWKTEEEQPARVVRRTAKEEKELVNSRC